MGNWELASFESHGQSGVRFKRSENEATAEEKTPATSCNQTSYCSAPDGQQFRLLCERTTNLATTIATQCPSQQQEIQGFQDGAAIVHPSCKACAVESHSRALRQYIRQSFLEHISCKNTRGIDNNNRYMSSMRA
ncbi:hypothetical protein Ae201684_017204 [Aphanomyces euteiches]|uniref:Uncharacterized protein n=1 Tax=Aphanomyces euteiches TaxID=100861 RepID=A0A6G0WBQ5_9STRA|nr:hypothetical protein Ae201684_017204 [Aphanomyces euteiches]